MMWLSALQGPTGHLMSEKPNFLSLRSISGLGSCRDFGALGCPDPLVCCRCGKGAGA